MKATLPLLVLALFVSFSSCQRTDEPLPTEDGGCAENRVVPVGSHEIAAAEVATANSLFDRNGIDRSRFRYVRYVRDTTQTRYPPYARLNQHVVVVEEYTHGLRIFPSAINYVFSNGGLGFRVGAPTVGTSLNATPQLSLARVRGLFMAADARFGRPQPGVSERCVSAELGYYNLNAGGQPEKLVKAWRTTWKNATYPLAYFKDEDGTLISYDDGFRTFH